jgi:hypothetical protein
VIETVVYDKLIDAIIDDALPKKHQMATQPDPRWAAALAANASRRQCHSRTHSPPRADRNASERVACRSSLSYLQGNASIRASLTTP